MHEFALVEHDPHHLDALEVKLARLRLAHVHVLQLGRRPEINQSINQSISGTSQSTATCQSIKRAGLFCNERVIKSLHQSNKA